MLTDLTLTDHEHLPPLRIERLARLNLLVGKNGVGKTTVLEAIGDRPDTRCIEVGPEFHSLCAGRTQAARCDEMTGLVIDRKADTLLMDNIGQGLHHTKVADLWRYWCHAAGEFGLQVFATTHSWNCIKGFATALQENDKVDGMVIRLEDGPYWAARGEMAAVCIDEDDLPIVVRDNIEIR